MYKCDECGNIFTDEGTRTEKYGLETDSLPPGYIDYPCCPACGSDYFTTVQYCENCENEITENTFCDKCIEIATRYINLIREDTNGVAVEELIQEILEG